MDNWNSNHENEYTGMTAQRRNRRRSEPANGQIEGQIGMRLDPVVSDEEDRIEELAETAIPGVFSMRPETDADLPPPRLLSLCSTMVFQAPQEGHFPCHFRVSFPHSVQ